jgi:hypothetical protein
MLQKSNQVFETVIASQRLGANGFAPTGRANARPMTGSALPDDRLREAMQHSDDGLLRRFAPRNDEKMRSIL